MQNKTKMRISYRIYCMSVAICVALQWRHNERDGVSNHLSLNCLLNRLFNCGSRKTSKLRVTGLCEGNSPVTGEFPAQRASNAENASIWWRHHRTPCSTHEHDDMEVCSVLLALCKGNPPVTTGSTHKGPVIRCFTVFFISLNHRGDLGRHDARVTSLWWKIGGLLEQRPILVQ